MGGAMGAGARGRSWSMSRALTAGVGIWMRSLLLRAGSMGGERSGGTASCELLVEVLLTELVSNAVVGRGCKPGRLTEWMYMFSVDFVIFRVLEGRDS